MTSIFDQVLKHDLHTHQSLFLLIWFYALIYFDFSGYSDMAIGFGRLMGYTMPENFKTSSLLAFHDAVLAELARDAGRFFP